MNSATAPHAAVRRPDFDLIRAAIVVGLTYFHTACIFRAEKFYVNNGQPSFLLTLGVFFAQLWGMPLLFIVSGGGILHSLRVRTPAAFVGERLRRLLLPLVAGVLLVVPPQIWYSVRASGQEPGSYSQFLGRFFDVRPGFSFPWVVTGGGPGSLFDVAHLWFLYYLLVYSLLLLPLLLRLRGDQGEQRAVAWLVSCCQRPLGVFVLAGPLVVLEMVLGTWGAGGWNSLAYLFFLLFGFLIAANPALGSAVRGSWRQALVVGVVVLPLLFAIAHYDLGGGGRDLGSDYGPWSLLWRLLKATGGWAWTVAILGLVPLASRRLWERRQRAGAGGPAAATSGRGARLASYGNEAVLPIYILHQTSLVVLGYYVVQWDAGILSKFLAISLGSQFVTFLIYDLCVRRTRVTRLLLGMRPARSEAVVREPGVRAERR